MRRSPILSFALSGLLVASPVLAETVNQLLHSGPIPTANPKPDLAHVPIVFGKDIKWTEGPIKGEWQAPLFGDSSKPGIYGVLIKWMPDSNSPPHFHSTDRYAYVVAGTWWVSSSSIYDRGKMYPVPAGSFVTDIKNAMHWDGNAKQAKEQCILLVVGEGPMTSTLWVKKDPNSLEYTPPETNK
jgi:hypothetical protein